MQRERSPSGSEYGCLFCRVFSQRKGRAAAKSLVAQWLQPPAPCAAKRQRSFSQDSGCTYVPPKEGPGHNLSLAFIYSKKLPSTAMGFTSWLLPRNDQQNQATLLKFWSQIVFKPELKGGCRTYFTFHIRSSVFGELFAWLFGQPAAGVHCFCSFLAGVPPLPSVFTLDVREREAGSVARPLGQCVHNRRDLPFAVPKTAAWISQGYFAKA